MSTLEQHLQNHIGNLVFQIAVLQAEVDRLKAELATKTAPSSTP